MFSLLQIVFLSGEFNEWSVGCLCCDLVTLVSLSSHSITLFLAFLGKKQNWGFGALGELRDDEVFCDSFKFQIYTQIYLD